MADETQKIVYFPEIPEKQELENQEDNRIDGTQDIIPGSITNAAIKHLKGENTAYGKDALKNVIPHGTTGYDLNLGRRNTMVGYEAGLNVSTGYDNTGIGKSALYTLDT